jgi:hypothetical protein
MLGTDGHLDPSHETLAARALVCVETVRRALCQLRDLGFVVWQRRLVRTSWRCEQTSNAYALAVPSSSTASSLNQRRLSSRAECGSQAEAPRPVLPPADVEASRAALAKRAGAFNAAWAARYAARGCGR